MKRLLSATLACTLSALLVPAASAGEAGEGAGATITPATVIGARVALSATAFFSGKDPALGVYDAYGKDDYDDDDERWTLGNTYEDGAPCMTKDDGFEPVEDGGIDTTGDETADLTDAFDGGLFLEVNGQMFSAPNGKLRNNQIKVVDTVAGMRVVRLEKGLPSAPILRSLITFTNTSSRNRTITATIDSAMGADNSEKTRKSSNGNARFERTDRWFVASDDPASPGDPPLLFVLSGVGAPGISQIVWAPEDESDAVCEGAVVYRYRVQVPARSSRSLLMFTEMAESLDNDEAIKAAKKYNAPGLSPALLQGIGATARGRIVNWDL